MSGGLKANDIANALLVSLSPLLESEGFKKYKPKQFVKLNEDVLLHVQIFPNKNDVYLWCAAHPLCQNNISLGSGIVAERFPEKEGFLKVDGQDSLDGVIEYMINRLPDLFQFLNDRFTMEGIEKSISDNAKAFPLLVKGFCLSSLGRYESSQAFIMKFINSGLDIGESRSGAKQLLNSLSEGRTKEVLEENRSNNIKKLRLNKYIS